MCFHLGDFSWSSVFSLPLTKLNSISLVYSADLQSGDKSSVKNNCLISLLCTISFVLESIICIQNVSITSFNQYNWVNFDLGKNNSTFSNSFFLFWYLWLFDEKAGTVAYILTSRMNSTVFLIRKYLSNSGYMRSQETYGYGSRSIWLLDF